MRPNKTLLLEIGSVSPVNEEEFYADLEMPAEDHEITDALQRARLYFKQPYTSQTITVNGCEILPELMDRRLDSPSIDELNFFANRLAKLSEKEALAIRAVFQKMDADELLEEPISMKDLINMTYGLDKVTVVWGMFDDEDLGRHVLDNNLHPELSKLGYEAQEMLDLASVGRWMRLMDGGTILQHAYVATKDYELQAVYDGQTLPRTELNKWYAFRLQVKGAERFEPQWITLPCSREQSNAVAKSVGKMRIEDCKLTEFVSAFDKLEQKHLGSMENFEMLNTLALRIMQLNPGDKVRFKAVLEVDPQETLEGCLDVSQHLREYDFMPYVSAPAAFYREYLLHHLGTGFDAGWISDLACRTEGQALLERLGAKITDYGVVSARGHSLFELVPYQQEETQNMDTTSKAGSQTMEDPASGIDTIKF